MLQSPAGNQHSLRMKTMRALLILGILLCHLVCVQGLGKSLQDCCLHTSAKIIPFGAIIGYEIQSKDKGCPIEAVVFQTNSNPTRNLCAPRGISWVKKWTKKLDKRKKEMEKNRNKPKKITKRQLD